MWVMALKPFAGNLRCVAELSSLQGSWTANGSRDLRRKVDIALVDDEPQSVRERLLSYGFSVSLFKDFADIGNLQPYRIFICDIKGILPSMNDEGLFAIRELRKLHPLSFIIAYTAATVNDRRVVNARGVCDVVLRKQVSDVSHLIDELDRGIELLTSPLRYWFRMRDHLLSRRVSTLDAAVLEHFWVKSVRSGSPKSFEKALKRLSEAEDLDLAPLVKDVAVSVVVEGVKALTLG